MSAYDPKRTWRSPLTGLTGTATMSADWPRGGMRRREFIKLTSGAVTLWALTASAQQSGQSRQVGFLFTGPQAVVPSRIAGFVSGLEAVELPVEKVTIL